jgi:hypothetical protein
MAPGDEHALDHRDHVDLFPETQRFAVDFIHR